MSAQATSRRMRRAPEYRRDAGAKTSTDATGDGARERQGVTGHDVNVVLLVSTAAVILAFAVIYLAFFAAAYTSGT